MMPSGDHINLYFNGVALTKTQHGAAVSKQDILINNTEFRKKKEEKKERKTTLVSVLVTSA